MGLLRFAHKSWAEVVRFRSNMTQQQCDIIHMTRKLQKIIEANTLSISANPYSKSWGKIGSAEDLNLYN
jgi:hypothetical protein